MGKENKQPNQYWFVAKKYGYGWGLPLVWQGWVALIGCLFVGLAPLMYITTFYKGDTYCQGIIARGISVSCDPKVATPVYMLGACFWLTAWILILVQICTKKGEKAAWRWGSKKGQKNNATKSTSN